MQTYINTDIDLLERMQKRATKSMIILVVTNKDY